MPPQKTKVTSNPAASAPSSELAESMTLLRYGAQLYDEFAAQSAASVSQCGLRLQRYGDYLEHFGFSPEREELQAQHSLLEHPTASSTAMPRLDGRGSGGGADVELTSGLLWGAPTAASEWRMPPTEVAEADALFDRLTAATDGGITVAGASTGAGGGGGGGAGGSVAKKAVTPAPIDVASVTARLTAAYTQTTWRQTQRQCERKRTRIVFRWLCQHLHSIRPREAPAATSTPGAADGSGGGAKGGRTALASGTRGTRKKNGKAGAVSVAAEENAAAAPLPPPDPLQEALESRVCTPAVAARLFKAMLNQCDVQCEVVEGLLKGSGAAGPVPWSWNCVTIGGRQYLVDVAATVVRGTGLSEEGTAAEGGLEAKPAARLPPALSSPSKRKEGKRGAKGQAASEAQAAAQGALAAAFPLPLLTLSQGPRLATAAPDGPLTDFYFFANPAEFVYTHFPHDAAAALLCTPPSRAAWDQAPQLLDDFFAFPVRLHSHPRSCLIVARAAPFYVTVVNERPDTTELCAVVYPGPLGQLTAAAAPLGPQWVWHQRREATNEETFTVMVPESGFYSLVLGARAIRRDPYSCHLPSLAEEFVAIARYQVKVSFTPIPTSLLPRQHLSPSVVRLMTPLSRLLPAGRHHVAVMPTCSNVLAVAVVAVSATPSTDAQQDASQANRAADGQKQAAAPSARSAPSPVPQTSPAPPRRHLLQFLPFDPLNAVYEGEVAVRAGEGVEVWVRYGAPDHNGLTLRDKATAALAEAAAAAPLLPPPPPLPAKGAGSKAGGHKGPPPPTGPSPEQEEREHLSRRVALAEIFVPAVTGLEVRRTAPVEAASVVQPQLTVADERAATLRRLSGVTARLYQRATELRGYEAGPVGTLVESRHITSILS